MEPIFALSLDSRYCKTTRPGNRPSFSATAMQSVSSDIVDGTVIGAFVPSGRQTTADISKADMGMVSYI